MSAAAPPTQAPTPPTPQPAGEVCPLCAAPLAADQEWCLRCGAAARTRLAAAPGWKGPIAVIAVIAAIALGVLAAALVKLAGDSGPAPAPVTQTVTAGAATTSTVVSTPAVAPGVATTGVTTTSTTTGTVTGPAGGQSTKAGEVKAKVQQPSTTGVQSPGGGASVK